MSPPGESIKLGRALYSQRTMKGLSLRAVAEPAEVSPTYLQKLERGDVRDPSPNILYRLSEQLGLDYGELMRHAGYVVPTELNERRLASRRGSGHVSHALSAEPLTEAEETALTQYLSFLRSQRGGPPEDA